MLRWLIVLGTMNLFSRQRLRSRLSIIVVVAMLWSHIAVASHSLCINENMPAAVTSAPVAAEHGCENPPRSVESAVCTAHCNQADQSNEVARVPPVLALPPLLAAEFGIIVILASASASCLSIDQPPTVFRHRPTAHPASRSQMGWHDCALPGLQYAVSGGSTWAAAFADAAAAGRK